jgi:hypothetical protein
VRRSPEKRFGSPERWRAAGNREEWRLLARARAGGPFFLKRVMGAPDSLQCLSGAHRTAHSSYAQEKEILRARTVHRTVHSAVSGAHRTVG